MQLGTKVNWLDFEVKRSSWKVKVTVIVLPKRCEQFTVENFEFKWRSRVTYDQEERVGLEVAVAAAAASAMGVV